MDIINSIISLGASAMMPVIFFIIALCFGVTLGTAFKAGMLVGIGFEGVGLVIGLLLTHLGPASQAMVERIGLHLTVVDTGWPTASTIGWGSPLMLPVVVGFIIINLAMLLLKITKTVNIDIFNYWIFLLVGSVVYAGTGNYWLAVGITFGIFILTLLAADFTAPYLQKNYHLKGISFPHLTCICYVPFAMVCNYLIDKTPLIRKINFDPETINKKFGVFGEPLTLGFVLGLLLALLAGYGASAAVALAIKVAAAMLLLPKMIEILVQGLMIVRDAAEAKLKAKFPGRDFYIGMDTALLIGEPSVLATGLLLIPVTVMLSVILPGNRVLPFVDLASLMFLLAMVTPFCKRNMFRMFITGTLIVTCILYVGSDISPEYTQAARNANIPIPEGMSEVTNMVGGATTPVGWLAVKFAELFGTAH
ncbi:PTS system galactitol-specific transporter subunit IIC [bacteria symbiont BFo1 of Frankliniella occidentalis]|uniref:PTS galactitol transporter subunit IIC n=1 Tax=Erwinia aphidicola TaxID=68334 RepID=UPI000664700D|nr:PTS transporter subunit IIC [Erwinia aphidicola]KMV68737.1 PTS system galactitol-specific transporter subunit IIC [bacteria symbiont BFo1 of Frankliniella occidentalis]KYP86718.1 PTS system galactitol-specific transporter subunit IIC [bacteria symbiont BFo1 of Frankliniella occidentalis]KYP92163.1 PTS system galactitol-specific transporter subunit IIC [bacteria symbiont BFo1 of Frankliniella occidentalis]MBD1376169.1 PTS galactitol transporter subunit IIC [Erwinia aphidicola]